ncbi:hypothetical protein N8I77_012657 [Diaporthe amygdali]|uniref:2EXR domain-containing protein n=1 Tax=Phomopsis amygdali TaxID=1214568 RepID=A0AAD9S4H0_PHOAM|nr:hypothetical protein N8I77_012657 [Diaporthe amygdali]
MASSDAETATPFGDQETSTSYGTPISNQESFSISVSEQPRGLFRLPPEIRLMIWELLLPGRRVLRARTKPASGQQTPDAQISCLEFDGHPKQPVLSQICQESRAFILDRGKFIFTNGIDGGFWWSTEQDVFLIDHECRLGLVSGALMGLDGLTMVRNIAVDSSQARQLHWHMQCFDPEEKADDEETGDEETDDEEIDFEAAFEQRTELAFRHPARCLILWETLGDDAIFEHPIPRFFPRISRLTVHFTEPFHDHCDSGRSCNLLESSCSITFDIPAKDIEAVVCVRDFMSKWWDVEEESQFFTYCRTWNWVLVDPPDDFPPNSTEVCKDSTFEEDGSYIDYSWDYDWDHRYVDLYPR